MPFAPAAAQSPAPRSPAPRSPALARILDRAPLLCDPALCVTRPLAAPRIGVWVDEAVPLASKLIGARAPGQRMSLGPDIPRTPLAVLHVVALGRPGALRWQGRTVRNSHRLDDTASLIAACDQALRRDGVLVLQASRLARGAGGQAFVNQLQAALKRPVIATESLIGADWLGGTWLTAPAGFASDAPFAASSRAAYDETLCLPDPADLDAIAGLMPQLR